MVDEFAPVCEVQSDKASVVITSRYKGKVSQILFSPGDIVKVGETLMELMLEGSAAEVGLSKGEPNLSTEIQSIAESKAKSVKSEDGRDHSSVLAVPAVRALAKEHGVDLASIVGTGKDGRIMKYDVLNYVASRENVHDDIQVHIY